MSKNIVVIGAGAWGTSLAMLLCHHHKNNVTLVAHKPYHAQEMQDLRRNDKYLPGAILPSHLQITSDLGVVSKADVLFFVIPAQKTRELSKSIKDILDPRIPIVIASKGIEQETGQLMRTVVADSLSNPVAILSGPNFADEISKGLPAAATLAAMDETMAENLSTLLRQPKFRCYASTDVIGLQVSGAVKNIIAIASGIVRGKKLGNNAAAALMSRGIAEMRRLGVGLGAKPETFMGLAGFGDLTLTCSSLQSRNMSLGMALGEGQHLKDILEHRFHVTEGVYTAKAVHHIASQLQLRLPICESVYKVLHEDVSIGAAIEELLSQQSKNEF